MLMYRLLAVAVVALSREASAQCYFRVDSRRSSPPPQDMHLAPTAAALGDQSQFFSLVTASLQLPDGTAPGFIQLPDGQVCWVVHNETALPPQYLLVSTRGGSVLRTASMIERIWAGSKHQGFLPKWRCGSAVVLMLYRPRTHRLRSAWERA